MKSLGSSDARLSQWVAIPVIGWVFGCSSTSAAPQGTPAEVSKPAACKVASGYPGDDACLVPPDPDKGMQFHYGPADYSNPDEVNDFLLQPAEEIVDCVYLKAPNPEKIYFSEFENSLRPNSHHMIVSELGTSVEDGHRPCTLELGPGDGGAQSGPRLVGGSSVARGRAGSTAPEDVGLADYVDANGQIEMTLHFINSTAEPVLREAWMNVYFMDPKDVKQVMEPVQGFGDVGWAIEPGANETWRSSMTAPYHLRMVDIYSHYHVNTVRMSAWKVATTTGERTKIYESYNWDEPGVLALNTVTQNPAPDPNTKTTGGISGILEFDKGDKVEWECEVHNQRSVTLRYVNKALDGEMCNLRGNYAPSAGSQWIGLDIGHKCTGPDDCPE